MKPRAGVGLTSAMVLLTLVTGMIEAVSFLVLGPAFTAVQTGNLLFLAFALIGAAELSPAAAGVSVLGFMAGAVAGSLFEAYVDVHGRRWLVPGLITEALLLACGGLLAWHIGADDPDAGRGTGRHLVVIALVSAAMGVRNVTTMRVQVPDVPTTVSTRALTAFLGGLVPAADHRIGSGPRAEGRRLVSVGAMFVGGLVGAWLLREAVRPAVLLLVPAAVALGLGALFWALPRRRAWESD
ncbi:YoaK family protein [Streptomyces sp. NPDC089424]|uniref:YoaK family protein n=1 Tax=Streptomyces sp. NPDC089424 TaxID=3365917 RepID=UPI0037FB4198